MTRRSWWYATETGYRVQICFGARIVNTFDAETLSGETLAEVRMQAAARAVELALEYRIDLENVVESREPL